MARTGPPHLDFRSDTRTLPDARMRRATAAADVGDDVYGDDPTVALLQERVADLLGTEAALFTPTGTMANLLAPLAAAGPPGSPAPRVIAGADTHMAFLESDGLRRFGGIELLLVRQRPDGLPDPDALAALLAARTDRPVVVCVENTAMMHSGNALDAEATYAVAALAHQHGAHLHLDGARLANAAVALAVPPAHLARPADSVTFSVSKGLGAPAGALLCGTREYVARARALRGWLGGSLHQVGVLAAPALVALDRLPDLAADHETAAALAAGLATVPGTEVMRPPRPTNMVMARLTGLGADECAERLAGHGVRVLPLPNGHVRFVTHRAHDMIGVRAAVRALAAVAATVSGPGRRPRTTPRGLAPGTDGGNMTTKPPARGLEERLRDTRARLENDVDLWVATAGASRGVHLIPLSYHWDGNAILVSTPRDSVTGRNLLADGRVRLGLGPTRDVVLIDGVAEPVDVTELGEELGDAFAARTGFDPRKLDEPYQYFRIRPRRVQAWRESNELAGRDLMRDGAWLG